jgi:UDP-3-O-[3-hydroxymyristoyl] glucosamine N-acyltransferase
MRQLSVSGIWRILEVSGRVGNFDFDNGWSTAMVTIAEIARIVSGKVVGDPQLCVSGAAPIRDAGPGDITLADDPRYASKLEACPAAAVVRPAQFPACDKTCVIVEDVHAAFALIVQHFDPPVTQRAVGVSPLAAIAESAQIGPGCVVEPYAVIGEDVVLAQGVQIGAGAVVEAGCRIGARTRIFPRCVLYPKTYIGSDCRIHAGAVLGADGFGYVTKHGRHELSAQLGNVVIGDAVEIGANSTVDRGTYNATIIGDGTKIDNLVMIAHNCRIGQHNLICSQVGIAGSCRTGDYVVMAGQVGVGDHVDIGERTTLAAQAGIMNHIPAGSVYLGSPALPIKDQMRNWAVLGKISDWYHKWKDMLKRLERIETVLQQSAGARADRVGHESTVEQPPSGTRPESERTTPHPEGVPSAPTHRSRKAA